MESHWMSNTQYSDLSYHSLLERLPWKLGVVGLSLIHSETWCAIWICLCKVVKDPENNPPTTDINHHLNTANMDSEVASLSPSCSLRVEVSAKLTIQCYLYPSSSNGYQVEWEGELALATELITWVRIILMINLYTYIWYRQQAWWVCAKSQISH